MKIISLVALSIFAATVNADPWLCVAEESTGFYLENGRWGRTHFDISEIKYVLREMEKDDDYHTVEKPYGLFAFGDSYQPRFTCESPNSLDNAMICDNFAGQFRFSIKTGRYLKTHLVGYWDGYSITPHIERGRCSKI